jgi:hypothetical protein
MLPSLLLMVYVQHDDAPPPITHHEPMVAME